MAYNNLYIPIGLYREVERLERQAKFGWKKELRTLKMLGIRDNMNILEVGCGPGFITENLCKEFNNLKITAIDNDKLLLSVAEKRFSYNSYSNVKFMEDNIEKCSQPDNTFDAVIVRLVYEHLKRPLEATQEIYRVLKPGGIVIIIDIDEGAWGLTNPENNLIKTMTSSFGNLIKLNGGDRTISRKLLKVLKYCGFIDLDFEVVAKHSDVLGIEGFKGKMDNEMLNNDFLRSNPKLYNMMKSYNSFFSSENSTIITFMFFSCGMKPVYYGN